jgi:ketosteroid isomerase-like protein
MSANDNIELIRRGYQAFQKGDLGAFDEILADDCIWHVPGRSQLSGDKRGRQAVVEHFGQLGQLSEGSLQVELHDVLAGEDHAIGLHRTTAHRGGDSVDTNEVLVFHIAGGRVTEAWEHPFGMYDIDRVFG